MTTDCSLNYKFNTWKFQAQNMGRTCLVQKLFLTFRTISVHNRLILPMFCKKKRFWKRFTCITSTPCCCCWAVKYWLSVTTGLDIKFTVVTFKPAHQETSREKRSLAVTVKFLFLTSLSCRLVGTKINFQFSLSILLMMLVHIFMDKTKFWIFIHFISRTNRLERKKKY